MDTLSVQFLILVPVVLGVTQVFKLTGLSSRWCPLVSLLLGVGGAFLVGGVHAVNIIQGIVAGLSASGLWSGVKATTEIKDVSTTTTSTETTN